MRIHGAALKYHRTAAGLSKTELARVTGFPLETIGRLESGKRKGTAAQIAGIAAALAVPIDAITITDTLSHAEGICPTCGNPADDPGLVICTDPFHGEA